jgi:hypothetical protein
MAIRNWLLMLKLPPSMEVVYARTRPTSGDEPPAASAAARRSARAHAEAVCGGQGGALKSACFTAPPHSFAAKNALNSLAPVR